MLKTDATDAICPESGGLLKANETTERLLEEDVKERHVVTVKQRRCFLQRAATGKTPATPPRHRAAVGEDGLQPKTAHKALKRDKFLKTA